MWEIRRITPLLCTGSLSLYVGEGYMCCGCEVREGENDAKSPTTRGVSAWNTLYGLMSGTEFPWYLFPVH